MKKIVLATLIITGIFTNCKKSSIKQSPKETILMAHKWKSTQFKRNGVQQIKWCWLNSINEFKANGDYLYIQGDNLGACTGGYIGMVYTWQWKLSPDEQYLIRNRGTIPISIDTFLIVNLTNAVLQTKREVGETWEDIFIAEQ
jgi:hypothetical protein